MAFRYYATHSGKKFDVKDLKPENICIQDVAHHLTKVCRYGGCMELDQHYSVAHHSLLLAGYAHQELKNKSLAKYLLMHDAAEAYLGDVVSGLKQYLPDYKKLEEQVERVIFEKYNIPDTEENKRLGKELDTRILLDEAKKFATSHYELFLDKEKETQPLGVTIEDNNNLLYIYHCFMGGCAYFDIKD